MIEIPIQPDSWNAGNQAVIDENTLWPPNVNDAMHLGPERLKIDHQSRPLGDYLLE